MTEIATEVLNLITAQGGLTTYTALYNALEQSKKGQLPKALKELKQAGAAFQQVEFNPETGVNTHHVFLPAQNPVPQPPA